MTIRAATMADIDAIYTLSREFQEISPYREHDISVDKFYEVLQHYLTPKPLEHIVLVYEKDEIEGLIAAQVTTGGHFFAEHKVATELVWYVRMDSRKGSAPIRLLHAYEEWAALVGCQKVTLTVVEGEYRAQLTKMYIRMGYESTEETFVRDI